MGAIRRYAKARQPKSTAITDVLWVGRLEVTCFVLFGGTRRPESIGILHVFGGRGRQTTCFVVPTPLARGSLAMGPPLI